MLSAIIPTTGDYLDLKTPGNLWHLQDGRILIHHALHDLKPFLCSREAPA